MASSRVQGATLLGDNYANGNVSEAAQDALPALFVDLASRGSFGRILADLSETTVYPGVWASTVCFTLAPGATLSLDGLGNRDAVFVLSNTGNYRIALAPCAALTLPQHDASSHVIAQAAS